MTKFLLPMICALILFSSCKDIINEKTIARTTNIKPNLSGKILVSHHTLNADYLDHTWKNHKNYAKKHNYDYWFRNGKIDSGRFPEQESSNIVFRHALYWQKLIAVIDAMNIKLPNNNYKYNWVMWIDADAFFTDQEKKIEDITAQLNQNDFFAVSADWPTGTCVNAGVWLVRNNQRGRDFMNNWADMYSKYKSNQYPEQMALQSLIYQHVKESDIKSGTFPEYEKSACDQTKILSGTKVFSQRTINSFYTRYAGNIQSAAWQAGDFIAHIADKNKLELVKRLTTCMSINKPDLEGCEVNGTWKK